MRRDNLARHLRESCMQNPDRKGKTPCPICSKEFLYSNLRTHIRTHTGVNVDEILANIKPSVALKKKRAAETIANQPHTKKQRVDAQIAGKYLFFCVSLCS